MYQGNAALAIVPGPQLTVLSHGMGQDTSALFEMYLNDEEFRFFYAPNDFIVVFSETGDEHDPTYEHLEDTKKRCLEHHIPFFHITPDLGYHSASWQSLNHFYDTKKAVGSKAFPKTCTDKLKLDPIYKFLDQYLGDTYNVPSGRKKGFREFFKIYGKVRVLIGISKGEEARVADPNEEVAVWKREAVEVVYPLIDIGYRRKECQEYIIGLGRKLPMPSNCRRCPFMSEQELVWLFRFHPEVYYDWVRQEQVKIDNNLHMGDKNLGVWGKKLLPQVLEQALSKYGHWSDEELHEYKMSHGHCVASKY